jgi:prolyl-tRNA editing enzyme YbaK/EbsC (Cys-tRNA(Pro) deacylase)
MTPDHPQLDERVRVALEATGLPYEVLPCEEHLADTETFSKHYGFPMANNANTILVASKRGPKRFSACVLLATTSLDVNNAVKRQMGVSKASFANAEATAELTGMRIGGVTAFGLPADVPVLVDARVMERDWIILGGGNRTSKIKASPAILRHAPGMTVVTDLAK